MSRPGIEKSDALFLDLQSNATAAVPDLHCSIYARGWHMNIKLRLRSSTARSNSQWQAIELDMDNASGQLHVHYSNRSAAFLK